MGKANDPAAVVDLESRVIGVDGLSVVDASIMPSSVRDNINLTVLMLAEMMADKLKSQLHKAADKGAVAEVEAEARGRYRHFDRGFTGTQTLVHDRARGRSAIPAQGRTSQDRLPHCLTSRCSHQRSSVVSVS